MWQVYVGRPLHLSFLAAYISRAVRFLQQPNHILELPKPMLLEIFGDVMQDVQQARALHSEGEIDVLRMLRSMKTLEWIARLQTRTSHQTEAGKPRTPEKPSLISAMGVAKEKKHVGHT